jgi:hypothetical protein
MNYASPWDITIHPTTSLASMPVVPDDFTDTMTWYKLHQYNIHAHFCGKDAHLRSERFEIEPMTIHQLSK